MRTKKVALSLFWRTFVLIALLLASGVFAWTQTFRALEFEPRTAQAAQQIASLVKLARAALLASDGINRVALVKGISNQESLKLKPREPADKWEPYDSDRISRAISDQLRSQLGPDTVVASTVNGAAGLWIGFSIEKDPYWLQIDLIREGPMAWNTITLWVSIALLATVLGSAAIARLINQPLKELSFAASRIREGEYDSRLDENTLTSEIRQVNMGFNRMARETRSPSYASHLSPGSRGLSLSDSWFEMPLTSATRLMPSVDSSAARASFTSVAICAADCVARGSNSSARKVCVLANTPLASSSAIRKKVRQNRLRAT